MSVAFGTQGRGRRALKWFAVAVAGITIAACGRYAYERREQWRSDLESRCMSSGAVQMTQFVQRANTINGPGTCGMDYPLRVSAQARGQVSYNRPQTLACQMVPTVDRWIDNVVQPAAQRWFGAGVVEVRAGSYSCRGIRGGRSGRMSEHSFGNALDVFAFVLSSGHTVVIRQHWRGETAESGFLREIFVRACDHFTTVLGPGSDAFHYDHFHLDLARHDPRWTRRVCRPRPETVQMLQPASPSSNFGWGFGRQGTFVR
ncbi:MAG: extensin family protein [Phreatobacter sp.]|uniref:extensin-like domain-containing protein n=1 Tax=Phreatobacter sp. TaxID=1966341 RepID=UPI001A4CF0C0|nr:extensin family protein [Phreatobacter sp.]MBL8569180.1 extensin family protein [Phreatobacter sp.]